MVDPWAECQANFAHDLSPHVQRCGGILPICKWQSGPGIGRAIHDVGKVGRLALSKGEGEGEGLRFPDEFPVKELAGKKADYAVTLRDIKEKVLPAIDDALATKLAPGKTLAELRQPLRRARHLAQQTRRCSPDGRRFCR